MPEASSRTPRARLNSPADLSVEESGNGCGAQTHACRVEVEDCRQAERSCLDSAHLPESTRVAFLATALHFCRLVFQEQAGAEYLAARVAAFIAAHGTVCLCADCVARMLPRRIRKTRSATEPGWCESCGAYVPDVVRLALSEYGRALRRRTASRPSRATEPASDSPPSISARCPICSDVIDASDSPGLVFRPDGRVEHSRCPDPVCPWCLQAVTPSQPKLRNGREIFHRDCLRASWSEHAGSAAPAATGTFR